MRNVRAAWISLSLAAVLAAGSPVMAMAQGKPNGNGRGGGHADTRSETAMTGEAYMDGPRMYQCEQVRDHEARMWDRDLLAELRQSLEQDYTHRRCVAPWPDEER